MKRATLFALPVAIGLGMAALGVRPAQAHHSGTAFDHAHPVIATGSVKNFVWANPHVWIYLLVPNGKGGSDEWEIQGPSVVTVARQGWTQSMLKPGDKVDVLIAPDRNGAHRGTLFRVTLADGKVMESGRI